ncbi:MAG: crossover junction endodeoxyribonuclease RuvC [Acidobacteria bacterium]|nr:crossover junction endodeoxyribonuclease RuvC [Acidobacteriota bacterium]
MAHQPRVIGIDPGSSATGWAIVTAEGNRYHLHDFGVIRPKGNDRPARLADLAKRIAKVIEEYEPDHAAVETPFTGRNPRSTVVLAEARGVLLSVLGSAEIGVTDYTPAEVKKSIVGHGRAEKAQVAFMVSRLLGLRKAPPHDAADAMAIALTHIHHRPRQGL